MVFDKWGTDISNFSFVCWQSEILPSVEGTELLKATQFSGGLVLCFLTSNIDIFKQKRIIH